MIQSLEALKQLSAFQTLPPKTLERLSASTTLIDYPAHTVLYHHQENLTGLHAILEGHLKLYRESGERVQILALLKAGDCFGTEALSANPKSSYTAATLDDARILFFPAKVIQDLMSAYPQFRIAILQLTTERLREFASLVHNLAFRDVAARLATFIVLRADEEGIVKADGIHIERLMTQSELATLIGTAREVIQRHLKKFETDGLLFVSRKEFIIRNLEQLRQIALEENR